MIDTKIRRGVIESALKDVEVEGYAVLNVRKIFYGLGKGNKAAGTWWSLLDVWEELGNVRTSLQMAELPYERILLTTVKPFEVTEWSGE